MMKNFLLEAIHEYQEQTSKREADEVRSIIKRRVLAKFLSMYNLKQLQGKKTNYIFDNISLAGFFALADPIFQEANLQVANQDTKSVEKSKWNRFGTWLQQQEWYSADPIQVESDSEEEKQPYTHIPEGTHKLVLSLKEKQERPTEDFPLHLPESEICPHLNNQLNEFNYFCTNITEWRKKPVRETTLRKYREHIRRLLAFLKYKHGVDSEKLDLSLLIQLSIIKAYESWCRGRGMSSNTIKGDVSVAVPIAEWISYQSSPDKNFRTTELVKTVQGYVNTVADLKDRPLASDEAFEKRAISMDQCWETLRYLCWRCKALERQHGITKEVIDAWMDYMILAIIITTGGRQRECRELTRKKIFVEAHDKIIVKLSPEDHKTGSATDRGREYPLFVGLLQTELSIDFLYYLNHILPKNLGHDYIFFIRQNGLSRDGRESRRGDPIANEIYLADLVTRTVAAVTAHLFGIENAKWTTPHDFRRIIATWVCTYGKPEHLPIYAELLGHSVEMLVKLYNKMRPGEHARQAHLAYADIAAREARIREWELSGQSELSASPAEMGPVELVVMLKGLVKKLWNALTDHRRSALLKILTREERELLDD